MSILTADYSEIIEERKRNAEAVAKDRPVAPSKKSRWREIEALKDSKELADLDPDCEFGHLWE